MFQELCIITQKILNYRVKKIFLWIPKMELHELCICCNPVWIANSDDKNSSNSNITAYLSKCFYNKFSDGFSTDVLQHLIVTTLLFRRLIFGIATQVGVTLNTQRPVGFCQLIIRTLQINLFSCFKLCTKSINRFPLF